MCGIVGLATMGETPSRELVRAMTRSLIHRGPDGEGILVAPGIGLGMRRLSVIDLVTGDQPMGSADGSIQVVFNGEIYNYRELRRELESIGYSFRTQSDTEVLPYLYETYGLDFLSKLNGMFAIAIWDQNKQQLLLARDRVGIKPLLFAERNGRLYFSSELKGMMAAEPDLGDLDPLGIHQYLSLEYTLTPRTLISGVEKLPAGGWLTWSQGAISRGRFWEIPEEEPDGNLSFDETAELLRETLGAAVKRQLISDVPLGTFLSGGIDSSILVAAISEVSQERPKTFSVGFGEKTYDELRFSRIVARHFDTDHYEEELSPDFLSYLETVVQHLDQPIADFSVFPTLLVSQMARQHVTVALGGDGGDELFCGYDTYRAQRIASRTVDYVPKSLRRLIHRGAALIPLSAEKRGFGNTLTRFLEGGQWDTRLQQLRWMLFLDVDQRADLYTQEFAEAVGLHLEESLSSSFEPGYKDRLHGQMVSDLRLYLTENILPKVDLMSMAVSLEARVPYLDNDVIDLALRIPSSAKWRNGQQKWILKKAFSDALPPTILNRGKEGFTIPIKNWLVGEWNIKMHELLEDGSLYEGGLFRRQAVDRLMREHESERRNHSHILWALMLYQLWSDHFRERSTRRFH